MEEMLVQVKDVLERQQQNIETALQLDSEIQGGKFDGDADKIAVIEKAEEELFDAYINAYAALQKAAQLERRKIASQKYGRISSSISSIRNEILRPSTAQSLHGGSRDEAELMHDIRTWELRRDDIHFREASCLGRGSYGSVYKGTLFQKPVAVKIIDILMSGESGSSKYQTEQAQKLLRDFRRECAVMTKIRHPNLLLLIGLTVDPDENRVLIVTELMKCSVFDLLHKREGSIPFSLRMKFAVDASLGMNFLHNSDPPIIHLDLKTENLLVDENDVVKVADFGLAKVKGTKELTGSAGTPAYMAPEILQSKPYDLSADVYSFGIVLNELVTQEKPYINATFGKGIPGLLKLVTYVTEGGRPPLPARIHPQLKQMIEKCWSSNPRGRPTFNQIISSDLDKIIIDDIITNPKNKLAVQFWSSRFSKDGGFTGEVEFEEFFDQLRIFCGWPSNPDYAHSLSYNALARFLMSKKKTVKIEKFNDMLEWFGPFGRNSEFVEQLVDTLSLPGFCGKLENHVIYNYLSEESPGTYLIRFSSEKGYYAITVIQKDKKLKSFRIEHKIGGPYVIGQSEYSSLGDLIDAYADNFGLLYPFMATPYHDLFAGDEDVNEQNYYALIGTATQEKIKPRSKMTFNWSLKFGRKKGKSKKSKAKKKK